jgi:hypothetical protein
MQLDLVELHKTDPFFHHLNLLFLVNSYVFNSLFNSSQFYVIIYANIYDLFSVEAIVMRIFEAATSLASSNFSVFFSSQTQISTVQNQTAEANPTTKKVTVTPTPTQSTR